jgi:hypothetical protein
MGDQSNQKRDGAIKPRHGSGNYAVPRCTAERDRTNIWRHTGFSVASALIKSLQSCEFAIRIPESSSNVCSL